jgi:hypothetical protein
MQTVWDVDGLIPWGKKQQGCRHYPGNAHNYRNQVGNTPLGLWLPLFEAAEPSRLPQAAEFREQAHEAQKILFEHWREPTGQFYMMCGKG